MTYQVTASGVDLQTTHRLDFMKRTSLICRLVLLFVICLCSSFVFSSCDLGTSGGTLIKAEDQYKVSINAGTINYYPPTGTCPLDVDINTAYNIKFNLGGYSSTNQVFDGYEGTSWTLVESPDVRPAGLQISFQPAQLDINQSETILIIKANATVSVGVYHFQIQTNAATFDHIRVLNLIISVHPDPSVGQNSWSVVTPTIIVPILHDVAFSSATRGVAVGQQGTILITNDAGKNWSPLVSGTSSELWSVQFYDSQLGYAIGDDAILRTTDGGSHWSLPAPGISAKLRHLYIPDINTVIVCSVSDNSNQNMVEYRSNDQGSNFTKGWSGAATSALWYWDSQRIIVMRSEGFGQRVYSTTDGGSKWANGSTVDANIVHIARGPGSVLYGSSSLGLLFKSTDDGLNWSSVSTGAPSIQFSGIGFSDQYGVAVGSQGAVARSVNGNAWVYESTNAQYTLSQVAVPSNSVAIAVGYANTINGYQGLILRRE